MRKRPKWRQWKVGTRVVHIGTRKAGTYRGYADGFLRVHFDGETAIRLVTSHHLKSERKP